MTQPIGPLNFILLYSSDIAKARAFYVDVLGMAVESESPAFLQMTASGEPGLSLALTAREPDVATTGRVLWWQVDDIEALRARLAAADVRITAEPQDEPFGRTLSFADPDSNILSAFRPRS
jgi:predicted enzyme related to lactoylglutathione lyase